MNQIIDSWREQGEIVSHRGISLFRIVVGSGPNLVCFHGFPSNSWDWHRILPQLARSYRVMVFDFPGFGLSAKPLDYSYSLLQQMDIVEELLLAEGFAEFDLLCHDMGTTVGCELFHRLERGETQLRIRRAIFLNGSVFVRLQQPLITQRILNTPVLGKLLARFSSSRVFVHQFGKIFAKPLSRQEYLAYWQFLLAGNGRKVLPKIAYYRKERFLREQRWTAPLANLPIEMLILWGREDPIAIVAIAKQLQRTVPQSKLVVLPGIGHYPQLEAPDQVVSEIEEFLRAPGNG